MQLSDELNLSVYRPVAEISAKHHVQLVQHTETGKFYVRKQLTVYSEEVFRSLMREPVKHVPQIYALAEDAGTLTVIEEYLPGSSLEELLVQNGPFPEDQAADLVLQLVRIVSALHHRAPAIIHRDIKPSNLILSPDGVIKLLDFNAAKFSAPDESRDTRLLGTTGYAAPEQYGFGASSPQTDLYAIGVLFHELLTGRIPSGRSDRDNVGKFSSIINKCTKLDPADRFANADELAASILLVMGNSDTGSHVIHTSKIPDTSRSRVSYASSPRRFLPPGFRSGNPAYMILSALGYFLLLYFGFTLEVHNAVSQFDLILNRIDFTLICLAVVFFSANYLGIQHLLPLSRSKNRIMHIFGIILWDVVIVFLLLMLLYIAESFL